MAIYVAGNKLRLSVAFTDANGVAIDPTTVSLKYVIGSTATPQSYNPGNIVKDSVGNYHFDFDTTGLNGTVEYEWVSTGTGQAAAVGSFTINALPI